MLWFLNCSVVVKLVTCGDMTDQILHNYLLLKSFLPQVITI